MKERRAATPPIFFVDDDPSIWLAIKRHMEPYIDVELETDVDMAVARMARGESFAGFVFDMYFCGRFEGLRLLDARDRSYVGRPALVLTGYEDRSIAMATASAGAAYIPKGFAGGAFYAGFALRCLIEHRCERQSLAAAIEAFVRAYKLTPSETIALAELCGVDMDDKVSARGRDARHSRLREKTRCGRIEILRANVLQYALTLEWVKKGA